MKPHEQRVVEELAELSAKIGKLQAFFSTPAFVDLPINDKSLLTLQDKVMCVYRDILRMRVSEFV